MNQPIREAVARELLLAELTPERKVRDTNKADNEIYIFSAAECPMLMQEIGRLREEAFRDGGGGTGEPVDIDEPDLAPNGYMQLIVWDPRAEQIVGGYRFIVCEGSHPKYLSTEHYFDFSDKFREEYLPYTIELGRSFVQVGYQPRVNRKGIYALDNLWDGLGAMMKLNPESRYFFGKVTMYTSFNSEARNLIIYFLRRYFPDHDKLISAKDPILTDIDNEYMETIFTTDNYDEAYKILVQSVRELGENIPPLINAYICISQNMKTFDSFLNTDFGEVEETGILITMKDIYPDKYERYTTWEGSESQLTEQREAWMKRLNEHRKAATL